QTNKPVATSQLRIAEIAVRLYEARPNLIVTFAPDTGRGVEAVIVFGRVEEVAVETCLRGKSEVGGDVIIRVQFNCVVFCPIDWLKRGFNDAQVTRLRLA